MPKLESINRFILIVLTIAVFLRAYFHAWVPDGGAQVANQPICNERFWEPGNRADPNKMHGPVVVILFMYGNAQLGLFIHDIISLKRNERIKECIYIHGFLATLHVICINFFWDFLKGHPYPSNPEDTGLRPGGKLWYIETGLFALFLMAQVLFADKAAEKREEKRKD